jgi:hypothetical protein
MIKFLTTNVNLGKQPLGTHKIEFPYTGDGVIAKISASCGCSVPFHDVENKKIVVTFKQEKIPYHIDKKEFAVSKNIFVTTGGKDIVLSFSITLY